ncbi:MAG: pyridoxal-phosphate dependent enzyme [Acidimicrobiia bacterium]
MSSPPAEPPDEAGIRSVSSRVVENPNRQHGWTCASVPSDVRDFHRTLPGYTSTSLTDLPDLASEFGVRHLFAKDESNRLGLPAFKALGASWAMHRALIDRVGETPTEQPLTMVAATDGNHGRAVAHFARQFGHHADIFIPDDVHPAAVQAIRDEGAQVMVVSGTYDDAVAAAASHVQSSDGNDADRMLIQDTSWPGYEEVARWIVDGYSTLFGEIDVQLAAHDISGPDLVVVPTGVGSLLQAAITHYRSDPARLATTVVSVEPNGAACVRTSVEAGRPVTVETGHTVMTGLNCGTMSSMAWAYVKRGLDGCVTVTDAEAITAARRLNALGVDAGPCGAAPLAALRVLYESEDTGRLALSEETTIVLLVTEGAEANPWLDDASSGDPG